MRTLVRWSPFLELEPIERRMRRMFEDFGIGPAVVPATDVYETDGEFVFELEVPGFEEKELTVQVTDHTLTVKGERTEKKEAEEKTYQLHERLAQAFERRFELPLETDTRKIGAEFKKGVLFVHAPKKKPATPQKIPIALK